MAYPTIEIGMTESSSAMGSKMECVEDLAGGLELRLAVRIPGEAMPGKLGEQ
jgi:hypothetical protein